jgi:predicted permease
MHLAIPRTKYPSDAHIASLYTRIVERVAAVPGVSSAAMVNRLPLSGNNMVFTIGFEDVGDTPLPLQVRSVTPDYFTTMGIALREGRGLTEQDRAQAPLVGVIDERVARVLWPGQRAIGRRFRATLPGSQPAWGEIVGVVSNIRHVGLGNDEDRQLYVSYHQFTDGRIALVTRTQADPRAMVPLVQDAIRSIDPDQPVYDVRTMDAVIARSTEQQRLSLWLILAFAASSLLLAGVGLYGVIAFGVNERRREFGVRLALGARPSEVCRLVLRKGLTLTTAGLGIGLVAAFLLTRGMESLIYNVRPFDPVSLVTAFAVLFGAALLASYVPARRAALTDPVVTLRDAD